VLSRRAGVPSLVAAGAAEVVSIPPTL